MQKLISSGKSAPKDEGFEDPRNAVSATPFQISTETSCSIANYGRSTDKICMEEVPKINILYAGGVHLTRFRIKVGFDKAINYEL